MATSQYPELVDVKLNTPETPPDQGPPLFNVARGEGGHNEESTAVLQMQRFKTQTSGEKFLRYFSVGRRTDVVICPMCGGKGSTVSGELKDCTDTASNLLCWLSCCFPIFSLCCLYACCKECFTADRQFCGKCGGYLGFQSRPN